MEFMEDQQLIIQQLKEMLRKSERELQDKDRELEDTVAKLQKFKLQSKAKIVQLTNQLKEKEKMKESSSSENIAASSGAADSSEQRNRGKVIMLKKQLDDAKQSYEKMEKDLIVEKEMLQNSLQRLQAQLKEKDEIILLNEEKVSAAASSQLSQSEKQQDSSKVQEMYAQMVYKDSKIIELNELISEKERKIMDLQELVKEKNEVLQTRNKAINLMTEDLNRKGKSVSDQLDSTRDEMRLMQETFIIKESKWMEEKHQLEKEIKTLKENCDSVFNSKTEEIATLQTNMQRLENVRFDLATRNAELQEKVVRLQDDFNKYRNDAENERTKMEALRKALVDTESQMDAKVLKARVKERSKLKALERQLEELKSGDQPQLAVLQQRIAELEEEKGTLQLKLLGFEENSSSQESDEKEGLSHSFDSETGLLIEKLRDEIKTLENKNEDQKAKLEDTQNQLQQIQESCCQKDLECDKLKTNIEELQRLNEEICRKMDALQLSFDDSNIKITEMSSTLEKYEEEKVSLEMKIIELEEQKDMIESNEKELLQEKKYWQDTLENEKQITMDIQKETDEAFAKLEEMKIAWKTTEEKNIKLQDNLAHLQDGCDQLVQKNIALQEELHSKINENEKQIRELSSLQQQFDDIKLELNREKGNYRFILEQNENKERQLLMFLDKYSISDISELENKWKENLDMLNDLENTLETETISNSLQIKEHEHMLEAKEISFKEEILKLKEIIKTGESEKHSLEVLINEKDGIISSFQKTSNENESYLLETIKEKENIIHKLSTKVNELKNLQEEQMTKFSEEEVIMESELSSLRKNLEQYELNIASLNEELHQSNQTTEIIQRELSELNLQKENYALKFETEIKQHKDTITELNRKLDLVQNHLSEACTVLLLEENYNLSFEEKLSSALRERENKKLYEKELENHLSGITEQKNELEKELSTYKTECVGLQERIKKYEENIEDFKKQLASNENVAEKYKSEVYSMCKVIEDMKEENNRLIKELEIQSSTYKTENTLLQEMLKKSEKDIEDYKEHMATKEKVVQKYESEIDSLNKVVEEAKEENSRLTNKLTSSECQVEINNNELQRLSNELNDLNQRYKEAILCNEEIESEIVTKVSKLNNSNKIIEQLKTEIQMLENNKEQMQKELQTMSEQIGVLKDAITEKEQLCSLLQETLTNRETEIMTLNNLQKQFDNLDGNLYEANKKISKLEMDLKTKTNYLEGIEQSLQDNALAISSLEENYDDRTMYEKEEEIEGHKQHENRLDLWIKQICQSNMDRPSFFVKVIEERIQNLASIKKTLKNELITANDLIVTLKSQHETEMNNLTKILENEKEHVVHLEADIENMKQGRVEMVANFNTATQALQDRIQTLELEKIELLKEIKTHEQFNSSLSEKVELMKNDEEYYKNKISQLEEEISEYSKQKDELTRKCNNLSTELSDSTELHAKLETMKLDIQHLNCHNEEERLKQLEENKSLEKTIEYYKATLEQLEQEWSERNSFLTSELDRHKMQLKQSDKHLQEMVIKLKEKEDKILVLENHSAEWHKSLKHMQADLERLQFFESEYHNTVSQFKCVEENLKEKEVAVHNLIKENENITSTNEKLQTNISELTERLEETEENFHQQKVALQEHIKESCNKLLDLDGQLIQAKQNISVLEQTLQEKDVLLAEHNNEKEILLLKLEKARNLYTEMKLDVENLTLKVNFEKNDNNVMKEYIKKMEEEKLKLADDIHSLEKENTSLQTKFQDTLTKYEVLKSELLKSKEHIALLEMASADNVQKLSTALEKSNSCIHDQESKILLLESSLENIKKSLLEAEDKNKTQEEEANTFKSSFNKVLEEREKQILNLTTKLNEMKISSEDLQQQIETLQHSESNLKEVQTLVIELETRLKDSFLQIKLLSEQLQEKDDNISKYKRNAEKQSEELEGQIRKNEQLHSENLNIISEMEILQSRCQEFVAFNCHLKQEIDTLHLNSKERDESYKTQLLEYESEIGKLKSLLEKDRKALTEMQMQYSELQSMNSNLQESMRSLQDEKDPTFERQNSLHELQNSNNALEYEVQSLRGEFSKIEEERNHLVSCLNDMSRKVQSLEQNNSLYLEEIERLKTIKKDLHEENLKVASLETELERISAENRNFQQKLDNDKEQLHSSLKLEVSQYTDKIACLEAKLEDAEMTIRTLTNECDSRNRTDDELQKIQEKFKVAIFEKESFQSAISELKNIIQTKDIEYNELSEKHGKLLSDNEKLSLDLQMLQSDCESLKKEMDLSKESAEKRDQENIKKQELHTGNELENNAKKSIDVISLTETVFPPLEREVVQRKEATNDMTQKLMKENEAMKNNLDVQKIKLEKMFAKLKAFKEKNDQLQEENKSANSKLHFLEKDKKLLESEIMEKTELLRRLTTEGEKSVSLYQKDISEKENTITKLKEDNKLLSARYQQIEAELCECSRSRESMSFSLEKKNRELDDLLMRLQQMEKNQASLEEQLANYDRQCNQLHYEKDCIQRELEDMKGQMEMLSSDNETFQGLLENLQKSRAALETELQKQREQHLKSFKEAQNAYLQDTEKLKKALQQSEITISTLQDQCKNFEEACAKFDNNIRNNSSELADKEKENIALQEKNASLSNELTKVFQELQSLRSFSSWESDIMDAELGDKTAENKHTQQEFENCDTKLMTSLKEAELKLQQKVNLLEEELELQRKNYNSKIEEMKRNILELQFRLNEIITKNENLSVILMDREKQWSDDINLWQQKETALHLQIKNLENQLQQVSHQTQIQDDVPKLVVDHSAIQNKKKTSNNLVDSERVDQLKQELQQVMYSLHSQNLRSENLSQEVTKLIEEKNTLQHQLSYYVNMARLKEKEQTQRSIDGERILTPLSENTSSFIQESTQSDICAAPNISPSNEEVHSRAETRLVNVQLELENLYQRIQESTKANDELQKVNDSLDEALRAERARRKLIEEELTFAKEEAILNSQAPLNNEYRLLIDEDEPQMFPETNFSISRRVKTHAYRLQHWLRRKRNHCYRIFRRMPGLQILFYIYILIIHVWFLICLF